MKRQILILPILTVAVIIRFYFLIKIGEPPVSPVLFLNLASILIFWIFLQTIFSHKFQLILLTLFLAFSPWHISFVNADSRINLLLCFFLFCLFPLIKIYQKSKILFTIMLLIILVILSPFNILRAVNGSVYHTDIVFAVEEQRREHVEESLISYLLHNKLTNYLYQVLVNYSQHLSLQIIFLEGNIVPEIGLMYLFDFVFLSAGLIFIIKKKRGFGWIIIWLFLSPLISSLNKNPQIHTGAYSMIIPLLIVEGLGLTSIVAWSKRNNLFKFLFLIALLAIWEISHMLHQIHFHL